MRTVASEIGSRESRGQVRMGLRAALRKARLRTLALESLEERMLLAVLPPISHDPNAALPIDLAKTSNAADNSVNSNESSPSIAANPADPQKLVAVWSRRDTTLGTTTSVVEGAFSTSGGLTWTSFATGITLADRPDNLRELLRGH